MIDKRICEMKIGENGYIVPWALGWPPGNHVVDGLNLAYWVRDDFAGTSTVSITRTPGGFVVGRKFYLTTAALIRAAQRDIEEQKGRHERWLETHRYSEGKEVKEMDCSKLCANFKPKSKPPFPNTLRTADLHKGMLVEDNRGSRYVIMELGNEKMKVLTFHKGFVWETERYYSDSGCQPYRSGKWNETNWLHEVK